MISQRSKILIGGNEGFVSTHRLRTCFLVAGLLVASPATMARDTYVLIGIDDYSNTRSPLQDLTCCVDDVRAVQRVLTANSAEEDVEVIVFADNASSSERLPTYRNIIHVLTQLQRRQTATDSLFVCFSGHGMTSDDKSHLCLPNFQLRDHHVVPGTTLRVDKLLGMMQQINAARRVLVVDACRNILFSQDIIAKTEVPSVEQFQLNDLVASVSIRNGGQTGFVLINSCMTGEVSVEDPNTGHSVFFGQFIRGLQGYADAEGDRDRDVTICELFAYCRDQVQAAVEKTGKSTQQPILIGGLTSDFTVRSITEAELQRIDATLPQNRFRNFEPAFVKLARREYSEAIRALRLANVDDILAHCDEALKLNPDYTDALQLRAQGYLLVNQVRKAVDDLLKVETNPALKVTAKDEAVRLYNEARTSYTVVPTAGCTVRLHQEQSQTELLRVSGIKRPGDDEFLETDTWIRVAAFKAVSATDQQQQIQEFQQQQGIPITQGQNSVASRNRLRSGNLYRQFDARGVNAALDNYGRVASFVTAIRSGDPAAIALSSVNLGRVNRANSIPAPARQAIRRIPNAGGWKRFVPGF